MGLNSRTKAAFDATLSALEHTRSLLSELLNDSADPDDRNDIEQKLEDVDDRIQKVTNEFLELEAETIALQPPSDDDVAAIKENADKVAKLTAKKATAAALLKLATDSAKLLADAMH